MNIYLIGYRCTGKSTVGRSLATQLAWPFIDADEELVKKYNQTISDIVAGEGWASFREKEKTILKSLSRLDHHIIATGGGVVMDADNVRMMRNSGMVIWLQAAVATIEKRMAGDAKTADQRPALTGVALKQEIEKTLEERQALYQQAMDTTVQTDALTIEEICRIIIARMDAPSSRHAPAGGLNTGA